MKYLSLSLFVLLFSVNSIAQGLTSEQIDSLVVSAMKLDPHAGLAVVVVKDGKVIHEKGYGVTSVATNKKVNEHTRFGIASNSKAFTSMALGMLIDEGKLKWTDKVVDYIPEFRMYDPYVTENFTIADLLSHRSGLALGAGDLMWFPDGSDYTVEDVMKNFQYQTPISGFRTKYDYNNLLFIVAGEIVVRISGISWSEFVETRIMKPLGMNESAGKFQRLKDKSNVAVPHSLIEGKLVPLEHMDISTGEAAAGIYASVHDLSKWMIMHMGISKDNEKNFVSVETHNEMWTPHILSSYSANPDDHYQSHYNSYGLGWGIAEKGGYTEIGHGGGLPGMLSKTRMYPEIGLGIVVLTNAHPGGYSYETISRTIADSYLNVEKTDWPTAFAKWIKTSNQKEKDVLDAMWETIENADAKKLDLKNYTAMYNDKWYGDIVITVKDDALYFNSIRCPKLSGKMHYYGANTFVVDWEYRDMECKAFASFTLDENGKAIGFTMEGISPNIDFSFDFHHLDFSRKASE